MKYISFESIILRTFSMHTPFCCISKAKYLVEDEMCDATNVPHSCFFARLKKENINYINGIFK